MMSSPSTTTPSLVVHAMARPTTGVAAGFVARVRRSAVADAGMATAEYAVGTVAACGFGGLLYKLLSSDFANSLLMTLIKRAFSFLL